MNWKNLATKILEEGTRRLRKIKEAAISEISLTQESTTQKMESKAHRLFKEGASQYDAANYTEAEINLTEALTLYKKLEKKDNIYTFNVASTLHNLACIYQETERPHKAESLYNKALKKYGALAQKDPDAHNPYLAMALHSLALLYWKKRNITKAESMYGRAIKTYRALVQKTPEYAPELGDALNNLGGLHFYTGDFTRAEHAFTEALHLYRDLTSRTPEYLPDVAMALNNLAVLFHNTGDFTRAEKMYKEALQTYRTLTEKNPHYTGNVAAALNNLGLYYWKIEEFKKAELVLTRALSLYRDVASKNSEYLPDVAMTLGNLGLLHTATGKFKKAEAMYTDALSLYRELSEHTVAYAFNVGGMLHNLGSLYTVTKRFRKAEKACREVLALYRDLEKKDPDAYKPYVAMALQNLGDTRDESADLVGAEKAFLQALDLYRNLAETHSAYTPHVAMVSSSLGGLYIRMGRLHKAEEAVTEALSLYRTLAGTHPVYKADVATALGGLGAFYMSLSKFSQSEKAFLQALAIERDLARKNPELYTPRIASLLNDLGVLYSDMGSVKKAESMYMKALTIRKPLAEKEPDVYTPDVATVLNNLGALYWDNDSLLKAEKAFSEALSIRQTLSQRNPAVWESDVALILNNLGNVYWKMGAPGKAEDMYRRALVIRKKRGLWFEAAESMSGLSLLSKDKTEDALRLLELSIFFSKDKKYMYAHKGKREVLYLNALEYTRDPQKAVGILEALRDQDLLSLKWDLGEEALREQNREKRVEGLLKKKIPPLEIPFLLPDDLLILYIQYREDHVLYAAVTREGTTTVRGSPSFVEVGSRLQKNLHIQLYAGTRGRSVDPLIEPFKRCTAEWAQLLPQEIQEELLQKKYIVLSPDITCSSLPLEGLLIDGEPLCLSKSVTRITSAHLLRDVASRDITLDSSLVVGNPWPPCHEDSFCYSFPSGEGRRGLTDLGPITYLEGAHREAQILNKTLPHARVLTDSRATADRILKELPHHSLIHLAGHGNRGRMLFFSGPMTRIPSEFEPELFSNVRKAWRISDSKTVYMMDEWDVITDIDILNTVLQKGTFVFLNACETGKSIYEGGGHFQGLAQAFLKSGASNVISSMVPLFDEPSTDFSVSFYTMLQSHHSVVTALHDTRRRIREKYEAQIYWLPYIHYGAPLSLRQERT